MKKSSTLFLKFVLLLIAIGTLAGMIFLPQTEGRNVNATLAEVYLNDPFLWYAYIASIPFFVGLFQAYKLLGYIEKNKAFAHQSVKALQTIKYCAITVIGFVMGAEIFIMLGSEEDKAGGIALGIYIIVVSLVVAASANIFENLVRNVKSK